MVAMKRLTRRSAEGYIAAQMCPPGRGRDPDRGYCDKGKEPFAESFH